MSERYDLLIAGGGMVGASLAAALVPAGRALGLRVGVLERTPLPAGEAPGEAQPSYDARSTALAYGARQIYRAMGLWDTLAAHLSPIEQIQVSDRGHPGTVWLAAEELGYEALGYVVENRWLGQVLVRYLREAGQGVVEYLSPAEVVEARALADGMGLRIELDGEVRELVTDLLVVADGGRSPLGERLGLEVLEHPYRQMALVANLTLDQPHRQVAWERFTDRGPLALLPLEPVGRPRAALIWTLALEEAETWLEASPAHFLDELQRRFGYRAGSLLEVGERHCYPLALRQCREQVRRHLVVLGNAAHTLHPIAGQGFNLALRGAAALAEQLIRTRAEGRALGELSALLAYQRGREQDQRRTILASDTLMRLFTTARPGAVVARNLGMLGLQLMPPVRHALTRSAMGLDVKAPCFQLP